MAESRPGSSAIHYCPPTPRSPPFLVPVVGAHLISQLGSDAWVFRDERRFRRVRWHPGPVLTAVPFLFRGRRNWADDFSGEILPQPLRPVQLVPHKLEGIKYALSDKKVVAFVMKHGFQNAASTDTAVQDEAPSCRQAWFSMSLWLVGDTVDDYDWLFHVKHACFLLHSGCRLRCMHAYALNLAVELQCKDDRYHTLTQTKNPFPHSLLLLFCFYYHPPSPNPAATSCC